MIEQYNLFGESVPLNKVPGFEPKPKGRARRRTMQEMYGENKAHKCRDCVHLVKRRFSKTYYKCALWSVSASAASDIRIGQNACNKFEKSREAGL